MCGAFIGMLIALIYKTLINYVTLAISGMSLLIIPTITLLKKNLQNLRQYQDSDVKEVNISPITV